MTDLPIQIVDHHDNPIGGASKKEAWEKGLLHRIIRISIFNEDGQLLVQKRSTQKELFPGRLDNSAAGHVDVGETYEQAAYRELREELGLKDVSLTHIGDYYVEVQDDWRTMKRFTRAYTLTLHKPYPIFDLPVDEVASTEWMDVEDVKKIVIDSPDKVTDGLEQIAQRFL